MGVAKIRMLVALRSCGCLSHSMIVDDTTKPRDVGEFWSKAHARGVVGREIQPGEELGEWECEPHRRERLLRAASTGAAPASRNREGRCVMGAKSLPQLIAEYSNAVGRRGPDSEQVRRIRAAHADNAEFLRYADALDRVKRRLGGSGMDRGAGREGSDMATHRRTWQRREGKAAALFGASRQYGSGSGGREDETCSDSKHARLFIEGKLRAAHSVLTLWREVDKAAKKEGKDPVVVLSEKGKHGQWLLIHTDDMPAVIANYLAAQEKMTVLDILDRANEYRAGIDEEA